MNVKGMLPFENMVADYVKESGNHVMYRVTPVFEGDNLLASGVLMEAKSVEDNGRGILFNVYCYNVQPDIVIDYATGDSSLSETRQVVQQTVEEKPTPTPEHYESPEPVRSLEPVQTIATPEPVVQPEAPVVAGGSYAVNSRNGKIHIVGACPATGSGDNAMTRPVYFNSYEEAEAYSATIETDPGKRKCKRCWK